MDVFPLPAYVDYSYRDEWTARHRGTDVFADQGAPVVAVSSGHARASTDPKGGNVVHLTTPDGRRYYYAHLEACAPELLAAGAGGLDVDAGELLGVVGTSGNAVGTSPHLHIQAWGAGGTAVDPFGELAEVDPHLEPLPDLGVHPVPPPPSDLPQPTPASSSSSSSTTGAGGFALLFLAAIWALSRKRRRTRWSTS